MHREIDPSRALSGPDDRLRKPEGRRWQDDDRRQPGGVSGPLRNLDPGHRSRSAGKRDERPGRGPQIARSVRLRRTHQPGPDRRAGGQHDRSQASTWCRRRWRCRARRSSWSPCRRASIGSRPAWPTWVERYDTGAHRLPALAGAPDGERADGGGRGPDPDPDRVLRARGTEPTGEYDPHGPRGPQPAPRDRWRSADDVSTAGPGSRSRSPPRCAVTSRAPCTTPSCRAASASPRRRATACRSRSTTRRPRGPRRTGASRRRSRRVAKTFGLGRGLDALHPPRAAANRDPGDPVDRIARNPHQPRSHFDDAETAELATSITAARRAPADRGPCRRRRRLRADRRRAPAARGPTGRPDAHPGRRAGIGGRQ